MLYLEFYGHHYGQHFRTQACNFNAALCNILFLRIAYLQYKKLSAFCNILEISDEIRDVF